MVVLGEPNFVLVFACRDAVFSLLDGYAIGLAFISWTYAYIPYDKIIVIGVCVCVCVCVCV